METDVMGPMQILRLPDRHVQHWLDALPGLLQDLPSRYTDKQRSIAVTGI